MGCLFSKSSTVGVQTTVTPTPVQNVKKRSHRLGDPDVRLREVHVQPHVPRSSWSSTSIENHIDQSDHSTEKVINILLFGESGVGKSTFINALANYLVFDTLEEAHLKKPRVVLPVSFLMTVGENFEERTITLGKQDRNEHHNQSGQSVTQRCKSHYFSTGTGTRIHMIDTPGMGDTRGPEQDDLNLQHILSYVNELSHLNAICVLLKPNESRLNIAFRSCLTQLVYFLGENIHENIVFCFTNTRSTFYTPGDTGPLLKKMLQTLPVKNIPFEKINTFCFDSESFRYLIARENGVNFDQHQKEEYEQSWINSVTESKRFLKYVCDTLRAYPQNNWQSIEHAQARIHRIIRPILETIRNLFRNLILSTRDPSKPHIQLCFTSVSPSSTICTHCKASSMNFNGFEIFRDQLHNYVDKCDTCQCDRKDHRNVSVRVEYKLMEDTEKYSRNSLTENLEQLVEASVTFGCFFLQSNSMKDTIDPIFSHLNEIIREEERIAKTPTKCLNPHLLQQLHDFREEYQSKQKTSLSKNPSINLPKIYQLIEKVNAMNLMRTRMDNTKDISMEEKTS